MEEPNGRIGDANHSLYGMFEFADLNDLVIHL